jgi:hypothetical protein
VSLSINVINTNVIIRIIAKASSHTPSRVCSPSSLLVSFAELELLPDADINAYYRQRQRPPAHWQAGLADGEGGCDGIADTVIDKLRRQASALTS